jgi:hypothetical protein
MTTKPAAGAPSTGLDRPERPRGPVGQGFLLGLARTLLNDRVPSSLDDYATLGARLAKAAHRREPYDAHYVRYILEGRNPITAPISEAAMNLASELNGKPRRVRYRHVTVRVPADLRVPEGTIVLRGAVTCICGESFIPGTWNQINHTRACAVMRRRRG